MSSSNRDIISKTLSNKMLLYVEEYERIKSGSSSLFKTVKSFCSYYKFSHQNFMKVYRRWILNGRDNSFLVPQKRGAKYKTRRTDIRIEEQVKIYRNRGLNRYEIALLLQQEFNVVINPSTVYNICRRYGLNRLTKPQKASKRKIIMSKIGELVHIDCHQLSKGITIAEPNQQYYILGVMDDYSRLVWLELLEDKKGLNVMFATMRALSSLKSIYGIQAERIITDNGSEFGGGALTKHKENNPFERLLIEMGVKHSYTKPYRPQTNGKIERFWKTLKEDFIEDALYENKEDLKQELLEYNIYYNEHRPHSAIGGVTPKKFVEKM